MMNNTMNTTMNTAKITEEQFALGVRDLVVDLVCRRQGQEFADAIVRVVSAESINAMVESDRIKSKEIESLQEACDSNNRTIFNLLALSTKRYNTIERLESEIHDLRAENVRLKAMKDKPGSGSEYGSEYGYGYVYGEEILDEIGALNESEQWIRLFGCYWRTTAAWTRDSIPHKIELEMVGPPRSASRISAVRKEASKAVKSSATVVKKRLESVLKLFREIHEQSTGDY